MTDISKYLQHLPSCTTMQNWDEALDAISRCPEEPGKWKAEAEMRTKMSTCSCGLTKIKEELEKPKVIKIKYSSTKDSTLGAWLYTMFIMFPTSNWRYQMSATLEGWGWIESILKKAGYTIEHENEPPK